MTTRNTHVDFLKGLAVIGMICFHFWGLLFFFSVTSIPTTQPIIFILGKLSASIFIFLSGYNLYLSSLKPSAKSFIKRVFRLSIAALIVTAVSYMIIPSWTIYFGILHFFAGVSLLLAPIYFKNNFLEKYTVLILIIHLISMFLLQKVPPSYIFLPFGYYPPEFTSIDYYPIFPWIYMLLAGTYAAKYFQKNNSSFDRINIHVSLARYIQLLGKYSLEMYMLHIPICIVLAYTIRLFLTAYSN